MRRRFAVKPKNLKLKIELFHDILCNKAKFAVNIIQQSPLGHYILMDFVVESVKYSGMRQRYVRHNAVDTIRFELFGGDGKRSTTLTKNELETLNKTVQETIKQ